VNQQACGSRRLLAVNNSVWCGMPLAKSSKLCLCAPSLELIDGRFLTSSLHQFYLPFTFTFILRLPRRTHASILHHSLSLDGLLSNLLVGRVHRSHQQHIADQNGDQRAKLVFPTENCQDARMSQLQLHAKTRHSSTIFAIMTCPRCF
jgi:hypothetical protein